MKLRIMTYNISSGIEMGINREKISVVPMAEIAKKYMPDILGLNEVRAKHDAFTQQDEQIAEILGYKYSFFAPAITINGGKYGNALVSKYPIESAQIIPVSDAPEKNPELDWEEKPDGSYYETRCVLKAVVVLPEEKIDVFVTHFGLTESEKESVLCVLQEELSKRKNRCVLMGDFNCKTESKYIAKLSSILQNVQPEYIDESFCTFASYKPTNKIDYIMVEKDIKVLGCGAIDSKASDHRPYFADIDL